jgi:hypothetical protein
MMKMLRACLSMSLVTVYAVLLTACGGGGGSGSVTDTQAHTFTGEYTLGNDSGTFSGTYNPTSFQVSSFTLTSTKLAAQLSGSHDVGDGSYRALVGVVAPTANTIGISLTTNSNVIWGCSTDGSSNYLNMVTAERSTGTCSWMIH